MYDTPYHTADLSSCSFLVTGGAGFIGSHIVEYLLKYGAGKVRILDNFSTGSPQNIAPFKSNPVFELIEGDIRDPDTCARAIKDISYISHQAALGSVPRSVKDPLTTHEVNISGFLNMLVAAKDSGSVRRFVYASSSSVYGDSPELPKVEERVGKPLSPYAVTKYANELYADVFSKTYGLPVIGLRYFNVFGPRQNPEGEYAAVIPRFIKAASAGEPALINGDGSQTRDFTFVENAVQANIRSFFIDKQEAINKAYNVACGEQISLNELWTLIAGLMTFNAQPLYGPGRLGDVKHSLANIQKAEALLGYRPSVTFEGGLKTTVENFTLDSENR
jgi:UDP-N-acetylglucosamine 4-epimerase